MKKTLYYVVTPQLEDIDGILENNGMKNVTTYSIVNGKLEKQFDIECTIEDTSEDEIEEYLIDNGMGDDDFDFIQL
jgi:hypothetical protein